MMTCLPILKADVAELAQACREVEAVYRGRAHRDRIAGDIEDAEEGEHRARVLHTFADRLEAILR